MIRDGQPHKVGSRFDGDGSRQWPLNEAGRCVQLACDEWGSELRQAVGGHWVFYCPAHLAMADGLFGPCIADVRP